MRSSAAERLIIEEPVPEASRRRNAETDDDFSIPAVAAEAARLSDPTASELAGLFHRARLSAVYVESTIESVQAEALTLYPSPPSAICLANGRAEQPSADWPAWKQSAYALWMRQRELIDPAREAGAMAYVVKPFDASDVVPAIELAMARYAEIRAVEAEVEDLHERLASRKAVDQAKGLLMEGLGLSEPEAFRWIQKTAMDLRKSMREVAEGVIDHSNAGAPTKKGKKKSADADA